MNHIQTKRFFLVLAISLAALLSAPTLALAALPPRPEAPSYLDGATITLYLQDATQEMWTSMQWQDAWGDWHDVDGWRGHFNPHSQVMWWVGSENLGTGPYRWLAYESEDGKLLAESEPFDLPARPGGSLRVEITLEGVVTA